MNTSGFTRDKDNLLRSLTRFDGRNIVEDETDSGKTKTHSRHHHTFLLQVLLEQVCTFVEPNAANRDILFKELCKRLSRTKKMDLTLVLDSFKLKRKAMAESFYQYVKQVHSQIGKKPAVQSQLTYNLMSEDSSEPSNIRYESDFEQLEVIAKGGFGVVCKARHRVDGIIYAVKQIVFKYKNDFEFKKVIREAKNIASLKHPNIVGYNNAWIQSVPACVESNLLSESSSESSSQESSSGSISPNVKDMLSDCNEALSAVFDKENKSSAANQSFDSIVFEEENDDSNLKDTSKRLMPVHEDIGISNCPQQISEGYEMNGISEMDSASKDFCDYDSFADGVVARKDTITNSQSSFFETTNSVISNNGMFYSNDNFVVHSNCEKCETFDQSCEDISNGKLMFPSLSNIPSWNINNLNVKSMLCIQMEYCDCDLRDWLDHRSKGSPLPFNMDLMTIFRDILRGVAHIHSKSIIHRDLKPKNIFFSNENGVMKIGDFGLATLVSCSSDYDGAGDATDKYSAGLGTLPYAAPEQRNKKKYDCKVDIYSLGVILIELVQIFGTRMEFSKVVDEILEGTFPDDMINSYSEHVDLVKSLIKRNPQDRLSAEEVLSQPLLQQKVKETDECQCKIKNLENEIADLKALLKTKDDIIAEQNQKLKAMKTKKKL